MTAATYPKRLIEVDLPIKRISAHARREKSIRHGHISTLHIWWARRPLAACRAVICAALWPDPADELCPQSFRAAAAEALCAFAEKVRSEATLAGLCKDSWSRWRRTTSANLRADDPAAWSELRYALLDFIADFANWDSSRVPAFLETARALTQAAHESLGGAPGTRPLVVDPFAGGGAIPLEALRVGADAFASDLNPVAVLLNKVVLEYIPRYGQQLADEVRKWGKWIKDEAEKELAEFYPKDPDGATPIAYLWARTIECEGPGCGAEVPLIRSFWLGKKSKRPVALRMIPNPRQKRVDFEIVQNATAADVGTSTVQRGSATCPCCGFTTAVTSVRRQLNEHHGGATNARLFCVVTTRQDEPGRFYRVATERDLDVAGTAAAELGRREAAHAFGPVPLVPDEPLPPQGTLGFRVQLYGVKAWRDLFTPRQALTLTTLVRLVNRIAELAANKTTDGLAEAVQTCLAIAVSRIADRSASLCTWRPQADQEKVEHVFARQALPMTWDFAEGTPLTSGTAGWDDAYGPPAELIDSISSLRMREGSCVAASATNHPLPNEVVHALITDPPYYDAVPYADLSDFFYVWLKRSLPRSLAELFTHLLTPKQDECIVDEVKGKDRTYYEKTMAVAMAEGRRILNPQGVALVVFAHKSTSGWESLLQALVDSGWIITGSWPIDTEMGTRLRARDSAALSSSVHLVCRPRRDDAGSIGVDDVGDWRDILEELPRRIHEWMPRLASEGMVGADAIFACLGPALEIYSRYSRVERASGEQVPLKEYLEHVWAAVAREALTMIFEGADATGFEEDARLTAMWLWTISTDKTNGYGGSAQAADEDKASDNGEDSGGKKMAPGGYILEYDAARKIAQGLGAHLDKLSHVVQITGDDARLLPVSERAAYLFGNQSAQAPSAGTVQRSHQLNFFAHLAETEEEARFGILGTPPPGSTVLDRVHQAMILFGAGRSEALRRFLVEDGTGKDSGFWRLAQALSALYPKNGDEKRWVDGVLARKRSLGF